MSESGSINLKVTIAGGSGGTHKWDDFYPYELTLEEGFSRIYRGTLTLLTKTIHAPKDLNTLLDTNISLSLSQRISGGLVTRSRYLHGIITAVAACGAIGGGDAPCYRYVLTIENELARLRHTRLSVPYYRKTPPDIIEEILAKYGIRASFFSEYINRSDFGKNLMFDQVNVSDFDFIRRIIDIYGISWTFTHGAVSPEGMGSAELYFTSGSRFPAPVYEYSDKRKVPDIEKFAFVNYDERRNVWRMAGWRMESGIGVDGMEVTAPYPEAGYGSHDWRWGITAPGSRHHIYSNLFHGYERGTATTEIDADVKTIIEARRILCALAKNNWTGRAESILPMPGLLLTLNNFYGAYDAGTITALVTDSHLHIRAQWHPDISAPPPDVETGELVQTEFNVVDWGSESEKRFCGNGR
jgi:hypothetical protein